MLGTLTVMIHCCCEPLLALFKHLRVDVEHLYVCLAVEMLVFRMVQYPQGNITCIGKSDNAGVSTTPVVIYLFLQLHPDTAALRGDPASSHSDLSTVCVLQGT